MKLIKINPEQYHIVNDKGLITHSTILTDPPLQSVTYLELSEVKELLGEVDVEKKADEFLTNELQVASSSVNRQVKVGFEAGYNQALEDNKDKKYTKEDMRKAFENGVRTILLNSRGQYTSQKEIEQVFEESLQPSTSWDIEFVNGKLKLI